MGFPARSRLLSAFHICYLGLHALECTRGLTDGLGHMQRWAPTTTLRALNKFSKSLYEECSYNCVQTWYCTVHFVCTGTVGAKSLAHAISMARLYSADNIIHTK